MGNAYELKDPNVRLMEELIEIFDYLSKVAESEDKDVKEYLKALRSRARDAPTEIFTSGLALFTVTYLAKSKDCFPKMANELSKSPDRNTLLKNLDYNPNIEEANKEKKEANKKKKGKCDPPDFGYGSYLLILMYLLKRQRIVGENTTLKDFLKMASSYPPLSEKALMISELIKRFSEAYLPEPESEQH
ncbi:MAG TPA: type III-B CRISPR module-associated protein Cmr5 [Fervidicoccus fontis]|uniref:CRISPR type III-B/RAMP module-associated protein Cmr5 n=1 Tax=Fervidicoccus fontis TaxID=683846 RepID=A0A7C2UQW6_9CREN|nr:type III-B CRISPR module-associated protein Cmr5 [Fervidicoccus fontis]